VFGVFALVLVLGLGYAGWLGLRGVLTGPFSPTCTALVPGGTAKVSPEQAGNAAVISAVSVTRGLPTRAAVIGVATAIQESKLRNLRFGDRDSLGLFQQRPSQGWGTAEQILDPVYASGAFYDRLVKVKDWATRPLTEVAQAVQRSAAPAAYAQHEDEALALASALTGAAPGSLTCDLARPDAAGAGAAAASALAAELGAAAAVEGGVLRVASSQTVPAWAVGQWLVARAAQYGVTSVQVGDRLWTRADGEHWQTTSAGAGTGTTEAGASTTGTTVTAALAPAR